MDLLELWKPAFGQGQVLFGVCPSRSCSDSGCALRRARELHPQAPRREDSHFQERPRRRAQAVSVPSYPSPPPTTTLPPCLRIGDRPTSRRERLFAELRGQGQMTDDVADERSDQIEIPLKCAGSIKLHTPDLLD